MIPRIRAALLAAFIAICCLSTVQAKSSDNDTVYVQYQEADGTTVYLADDRQPSLYTQDFGDCLGNSLINVTQFDAAYYQDNMTVLFNLVGETALQNQSVMMWIGVYAYGESRFDILVEPCIHGIQSMCPVNPGVPIEAFYPIPLGQSDTSIIPSIALSIPDFEGVAILRIFANATEQEIGCYSAVLTNGQTFSHPSSVGTVLGLFTLVALIASFATAIYGEAVPTMRLHYAHSLSVGVVFAVFQHIFFTGALSVNWPSVLVAWWSNFAWAGGMINTASMQNSINHLIGNNIGNTSQVGAAASGSTQETLGGGVDISQIYKRALPHDANHPLFKRDMVSEIYRNTTEAILKRDSFLRPVGHALHARDTSNATGSTWYGSPVATGLPLPGNYSGFAGTLGQESIRTSNAFMTGFLWFLILLVLLVASVMAFKWALEGLTRVKLLKQDRLRFFREHWLAYSAAVALRTCFLGFFMIMFLTIFQFTYQSNAGVKAIAGIVFVIFLFGMIGAAWYALAYKKQIDGRHDSIGNPPVERKKLLGRIPWFGGKKARTTTDNESAMEMNPPESKDGSTARWKHESRTGSTVDEHGYLHSIHDNEDYTMKFGWLMSRFRRTRWWFFVVYLFYEFLRAVFYAGASGYAMAQVFGLLVIECLAFGFFIWARPFEGRRLNILVVYCLGFSKVASVALSAAFDVQFNLPRIITTAIGIIIIVIQGILTIITMIAIIVGAVSSYMSVSRNHETFRPRKWEGTREKYFNHLDRVVNDLPREPKPKKPKKSELPHPEEPKEPYFGVTSVRRLAKIEDEDKDFSSEMRAPQDPAASYLSLDQQAATPTRGGAGSIRSGVGTPVGRSRAASLQSVSQANLPYGARQHRPSWSTRDFSQYEQREAASSIDRSFTPVDMSRTVPEDDVEPIAAPSPAKTGFSHFRSPSRSSTLPSKLQPMPSKESLRVGGDISTRDTIGSVPAPTMRPRAGTHGSLRSLENSNRNTGASFDNRSSELLADPQYHQFASQQAGGSSQRANRNVMLTPAQEQEEFGFLPKTEGRR